MTPEEISPIKIHEALNVLVGLPMRAFGRATNLIWLSFGKSHEVPARLGGTKVVNDWALHLQCSWRLCRRGRIEVADLDCYRDALDEYLEDWGKPGKSRFDDYAVTFRLSLEAGLIFVEAVSVDDVGGFSLSLTGGL